MRQQNDKNTPQKSRSLKPTLMMFAFGICILAFLVAIDRQNWLHLRPASGTAAAMWHASEKPAR